MAHISKELTNPQVAAQPRITAQDYLSGLEATLDEYPEFEYLVEFLRRFAAGPNGVIPPGVVPGSVPLTEDRFHQAMEALRRHGMGITTSEDDSTVAFALPFDLLDRVPFGWPHMNQAVYYTRSWGLKPGESQVQPESVYVVFVLL